MYDLIRGDTFHMMLYAVVTAMALMASCYLLFRQGNWLSKVASVVTAHFMLPSSRAWG